MKLKAKRRDNQNENVGNMTGKGIILDCEV
jgi:hypothetical protein